MELDAKFWIYTHIYIKILCIYIYVYIYISCVYMYIHMYIYSIYIYMSRMVNDYDLSLIYPEFWKTWVVVSFFDFYLSIYTSHDGLQWLDIFQENPPPGSF